MFFKIKVALQFGSIGIKNCSTLLEAPSITNVPLKNISDGKEPKLIVAGGRNASNSILSSVEIFNPDKKMWELGPPLPEPINRGSGLEYDGDFLVGGGLNMNGETRKIYRFNLKSGWTKINSKPLPENSFGSVVLMVKREFCLSTR